MKILRKGKQEVCLLHEQKNNDDSVISYFTFPMLDQISCVEHMFTTRKGGVSEGIYASMNLSYTRGDDPNCVTENYKRVASVLHADLQDFVCSDQTHTDHIRVITDEDRGKGVCRERDYFDVDGLITNVPGIVLTTFFADCVPLFFVDPVHKAIGMTHSGWRGTVQKIGAKTLMRMEEEYGTKPGDVYAAIGPSICRDCYEVSADVIDEVDKCFSPDKDGKSMFYIPGAPNKFQLDLWELNKQILLSAGILPEHLQVTDICTCCNPNLLFSHRASKGKRGNLAAFLKLKQE